MDIAAHRANPEVSLGQHTKRRVVELGQLLERRAPIYLDTKFWIILRDSANDKRTDTLAIELLKRLRSLIGDGTIFCPISDSTFSEFMKRGDLSSRLEMARIVDELSLGVTFVDSRARMSTEVAHFVHSFQNDGRDLHPLHHLVWSKLAYALGFLHPTETAFDAETELAIQKAFFDQMWDLSLEEMTTAIGAASLPDGLNFDVSDMNKGVEKHAHELKSFEQRARLQISVSLNSGSSGRTSSCFSRATRRSLIVGLAPRSRWTSHIHASLHAAFRWDKARRFTSNDLYDFEHASAALAHCRAFFTEGALRATISARNVELDKLFGCQVVSEIPDAIDVLKAFEADRGGRA